MQGQEQANLYVHVFFIACYLKLVPLGILLGESEPVAYCSQSTQTMFLTLKKSLQVTDFIFPFGSSLASEASYVFLSCPKTREKLSQQFHFEKNNFEVEQKGFHLALEHILSLKIMLEGNFS